MESIYERMMIDLCHLVESSQSKLQERTLQCLNVIIHAMLQWCLIKRDLEEFKENSAGNQMISRLKNRTTNESP